MHAQHFFFLNQGLGVCVTDSLGVGLVSIVTMHSCFPLSSAAMEAKYFAHAGNRVMVMPFSRFCTFLDLLPHCRSLSPN